MVEEDVRDKSIRGRKPLSLRDMSFVSALKVYTTFPLRGFMTDVRDARDKGYVSGVPHFSLVSIYMSKAEMTEVLDRLITLYSLPLREIETKFAVDSIGFTISKFTDYRVEKHNMKRERQWVKANLICGVETNIITTAKISNQHSADTKYFHELVERTHKNGFDIKEVSADKAYSSRENIGYVGMIGGIAYIPFKFRTSGKARGSLTWKNIINIES